MNKTQGGKKDTNSHNYINTDTEGKDTRGYLINQGTIRKKLKTSKEILYIDHNTNEQKHRKTENAASNDPGSCRCSA